jgi:hypothetical protein
MPVLRGQEFKCMAENNIMYYMLYTAYSTVTEDICNSVIC